MTKIILHLTIKRKWFDLITLGKKPLEFREIKPYWTSRLLDKIINKYNRKRIRKIIDG